MARLKLNLENNLDEDLRAILIGQTDALIAGLQQALDGEVDEGVHEARKAAKKARAMLRLCRGTLGKKTYRQHNHFFRDAGRALSPLRDATVLGEAMDKTLEHCDPPAQHEEALKTVAEPPEKTGEEETEDRQTFIRIIADCMEEKDRINELEFPEDFEDLAEGFRKYYSRAAKLGKKCLSPKADAETFHEWRKRAKDVRYIMKTVEPLWPNVNKAFSKEVKKLTKIQGDLNDNYLLEENLPVNQETSEVDKGIERQREKLKARARFLGRKVFAESDDQFYARQLRYWKAERKD